MSVSWECRAGENDVIYFIDNCIADVDKSIEYKVGDKVQYLECSYGMVGDNQEILIRFKDNQNRIYTVVESFFVTEDVWEGLKNYFKEYFRNEVKDE